MAVKAKLEQVLASDTTYREPVGLAAGVCRVDIRGGIQHQIVGAVARVYRRGPIEAVSLRVARATAHVAGKNEVYRTRS